jgi:hypothetical protein
MKVEDNKIVIKKTIELMKKYNIGKEYQKEIQANQLKLEKINRQWEEKSNYIDWKLLEEEDKTKLW